ncbi:MAG: uncharacterized protein QOJ60_2343 [Actinomycetota bacterium]|jgi:uncharacterized cupin superfamily protein|nr:uncharacterized protein [Actinomycetota bacterium]
MTETALPPLVSLADAMSAELQPDPDPPEATHGEANASYAELYRDDVVECGVWEVTPGVFPSSKDGVGEHMHILAGSATVTGDDGVSVELSPGVTWVAPDGWRGTWDVRETIRKVYVIWRTG